MILFDDITKNNLIDLLKKKNIGLEGNIIRLISSDDDDDFKKYLDECYTLDIERRRKRLEITKQIQQQNIELSSLNAVNQNMMSELQNTLKNIEESKNQIELKNQELQIWKNQNESMGQELLEEMKKSESARINAENAFKIVENDLDVLQKRTQNELINTIVRSALYLIIGVGVTTTILYLVAIYMNTETENIGSTWSNMFGILLTNAFSIVGTIMGVKYASDKNK
jgi:hypothetical protein